MLISGLLIILVLLALILSKKMSALSALILVPVVGGLLAGLGWETFHFAIEGIKSIAPVLAMFIFAILFFSLLTDAGLFDPIIQAILQRVGNQPVFIVLGTAVLAMLVHFDGSGATTFLIAIPAMLPLYDKLKLDRRVLACVVSLAAGTMNMVPWGGPTLRASSALEVEISDLYAPLLIPQLGGLLFVLAIAAWLGKQEASRLKELGLPSQESTQAPPTPVSEADLSLRRPRMFWLNLCLALATIAILISGLVPPAMAFMVGTLLVLFVNYPQPSEQKNRILAHSEAALLMAAILLAAGVFTGIMKESGMIQAMAEGFIQIIPQEAGSHLPLGLAVSSMPLSFLFDPNSFYFGVLPVLAQTGVEFGIEPATMGQAAILGQMTTGFPLSPLTAATFLLIGLAKVDLADHQRFTFKYAFLTSIVMTIIALLMGVIPW